MIGHVQVFRGDGEQGFYPLAFRIAVHRFGNGPLENGRDVAFPSPGIKLPSDVGLERLRRFAFRHAQVDGELEGFIVHGDVSQRSGKRAHEFVRETDAEFAAPVVQAPVIGGLSRRVGDVIAFEGNVAVKAVDEVHHSGDGIDA